MTRKSLTLIVVEELSEVDLPHFFTARPLPKKSRTRDKNEWSAAVDAQWDRPLSFLFFTGALD